MKRYLLIFTLLGFCIPILSQQSDVIRFNFNNQFLNNPASTAVFYDLSVTGYHQKAFTGINRSPAISFLSLQLPFRDWNMSAGVSISSQTLGVIRDSKLNLRYSYKMRNIFSGSDYFSIGIGADIGHLNINGSALESTVDLTDFTLSAARQSNVNFNFSTGIMYSSDITLNPNKSFIYQVGVSTARTIVADHQLESFSYKNTRLYSGFIKTYMRINADVLLTTQLEVAYERADLIDNRISASFLLKDLVIAGLSFDSNNFASFEVGGKLPEKNQDSDLYIIVSGGIPVGSRPQEFKSGYGIKVRYTFDVSNY